MARETRGSASKPAPSESSTTPSKRKRRTSASSPPPPPPTTSLKLTLPSPSSINPSLSKLNGNGTQEHDLKRQRISLKVNANGDNRARSRSKSLAVEDEGSVIHVEDGGDVKGRKLGPDVREALALVISQMAIHLPPPLDGILSLSLPPDFTKTDENTLGYVLRQESLTWESLVDLLHLFSENLLVPCSYPNPMPSLAQFHQSLPPLPSNYRPHAIYDFCAALYALLLELEPQKGLSVDTKPPEGWALMQKLPYSQGGVAKSAEWFTSAVDTRATEAALEKIKREGGEAESTLLETLAATGDKFGFATPVSVQSTIGSSSTPTVHKLSDAVIRKASLKMARWKELQAKRKGYFGSIARGVKDTPPTSTTSWTPSFAPTYDSTTATGGGSYYTTTAAMHERARTSQWAERALDRTNQPNLDPEPRWHGAIEAKSNGEQAKRDSLQRKGEDAISIDQVLDDHSEWVRELQEWQDIRVRKGDIGSLSEREHLVASTLLASLTDLAGNLKPSDLVTIDLREGLAHELSKRFLPVSSPGIRGTLDPTRPRAVQDNATIRPRPAAPQNMNGVVPASPNRPHGVFGSSPNTAPVPGQMYQNYPPQSPSARQPIQQIPSPAYRPPPNPSYNPYSPSPVGSTIYGRSGPISGMQPAAPQTATQTPYRPGPGPSNLRQSFGPGVPPLYGNNSASGLMSQASPHYRPGMQ